MAISVQGKAERGFSLEPLGDGAADAVDGIEPRGRDRNARLGDLQLETLELARPAAHFEQPVALRDGALVGVETAAMGGIEADDQPIDEAAAIAARAR